MQPNFADKTIWTGDNLDILRGMNSESVDLIYLDPPFNSNRNYSAAPASKAASSSVIGMNARDRVVCGSWMQCVYKEYSGSMTLGIIDLFIHFIIRNWVSSDLSL